MEIKIECPEGYVIDYQKSSVSNIVLKRETHGGKTFPRSYDEFLQHCGRGKVVVREIPMKHGSSLIALMRLLELRDYYNDGWEPDWDNIHEDKYCIKQCGVRNKYPELVEFSHQQGHSGVRIALVKTSYSTMISPLSFKSEDIAKEFLNNFIDLIKAAAKENLI